MCRNPRLEERARAPTVLAAGGEPQRVAAQVGAAAPVTGGLPERREPRLAAVAGDAHAVHAGTTRDRNPPTGVGAGTKHCERVVSDPSPLGPIAAGSRRLGSLFLVRKVDPGEQEKRLDGLLRRCELGDQATDDVERRFDSQMVRRASGTARCAEHGAVFANERDVRLRVAAVDRKREPHRGTSDSSSAPSSSASTWATWPMSGWASNALRAVTRSRVAAASAA